MPNPWDYAKASEHSHQAALMMYCNMACRFGVHIAEQKESYEVPGFALAACNDYRPLGVPSQHFQPLPQLKWLHAIHNQGHGDAIRGGKAKAEGVKAGVSDMFLPVPKTVLNEPGLTDASKAVGCRVFHGLYLELKVGKGKPSDKQIEFANDMTAAGYATCVAVGWLEAREKILSYLGIAC